MILILYIVLSYLVILGMMIENYSENEPPKEAWLMFTISPIILPVLIGMIIAKK